MANDNELDLRIIASVENLTSGVTQAKTSLNSLGKEAEVAAGKMNVFSRVGAQGTRELVVLAHELLRGNWSRLPGSVMVLGERMNALDKVINSVKAGFTIANGVWAGTLAIFGMVAYKAMQTSEDINKVQIALQGQGNAGAMTADQIGRYISKLDSIYNISKDEATAGITELTHAFSANHKQMEEMVAIMPGVAVGMGIKLPQAGKVLAAAINAPEQALKQLQERFHLLNVAQLEEFMQAQKSGNQMREQEIILDALSARYGGLEKKQHTLIKSFEDVGHSISYMTGAIIHYIHVQDLMTEARDKYGKGMQMGSANDPRVQAEFKRLMANTEEGIAAAKEKQAAAAENKLAAEHKDQQVIESALMLQKTLKDQVDKEAHIDEQIKTIQDGITAAKREGNKEAQKSLQLSIDSLEVERKKQMSTYAHQAAQSVIDVKRTQMQEDIIATGTAYDKQKQIVEKYLQWLKKAYPQETKEIQTAQKQIVHIQAEAAKESQRQWMSFFNTFNHGMEGMLTKTQSWRQVFSRIELTMVQLAIKNYEMMLAKWISVERAKSTATLTGNALRVSSDKTAAKGSVAAQTKGSLAVMAADASKAYGGVYGFLSPVMGPLAAIPAAAAYAAILAKDAMIPSYDVGTPFVPQTGLAMIHQGEAIIPANMNKGNLGGGVQAHFHINAIDAQGVKQFLDNHGGSIAQQLAEEYRRGNSAFRSR